LNVDVPQTLKAATIHHNEIMTKEAIPVRDEGGYWQINAEEGIEWKLQK